MRKSMTQNRERRAMRVRSRMTGTNDRPRLSVFRSNKHITAQLIDDVRGVTLVSVQNTKKDAKGTKSEKAASVGTRIAEKALKKGIKKVVFDRGSYRYHGRVAKLADAARKAGLEF